MRRPSSGNKARSWLLTACIVAGLISASLAGEWKANRDLSPGQCTTLECFAKTKPDPQRLAEVRLNGSDYIVWIGDVKPIYTLASGPSCYVFNHQGQLVAWSPETGEGGNLDEFHTAAFRAAPAELEALLTRINKLVEQDGRPRPYGH